MSTEHTPNLALVSQARTLAASGAARSIRIAAGLSLREVAKALDVSPSSVVRWEHGRRQPRAAAAERYGLLLQQLIETR